MLSYSRCSGTQTETGKLLKAGTVVEATVCSGWLSMGGCLALHISTLIIT